MKHHFLHRIATIFIISHLTFLCNAAITPLFTIRSQGQDTARELAGWTPYVNLFEKETVYGAFSLTPEYACSFNSTAIARSLFGDLACSPNCPSATINISGSRTARGVQDWLADYFYLPTDFSSTIHFTPVIQNALIDIDFYLGLDKWMDGLFFRFQAPVVWTQWSLNYNETVANRGVQNYDPGYFNGFQVSPTYYPPNGIGIFRDNLLESFSRYAIGDTIITPTDTLFNSLQYAKIDNCHNTKTTLADIHLIFGWNFFQCDDYHVGLGFRLVAPTGSRIDGHYLFEPIVGNGKHWEVGVHFTSHALLYQSCDESTMLGFYCDANVTHLLNAPQRRTFDLKNKPFSRYMLATRMFPPVNSDLVGQNPGDPAPIAPFAQFKQEFIPVANISTLDVRVSIGVQADVAAQLSLVHNNVVWDVGYNFWATSCEKISSSCPCNPCTFVDFQENNWALKGDAYVVGFASATDPITPMLLLNQPIALSATQSQATINAGANFPATGAVTPAQVAAGILNVNIDAPKLAYAGGSKTALNASPTAGQTSTSIQPVLITAADLAIVGNRGLSQKIYSHLSYNWFEHPCWTPYLGVGGFAEFAGTPSCISTTKNNCTTASCCDSSCTQQCIKCSLSQWGIWLKGGVAF